MHPATIAIVLVSVLLPPVERPPGCSMIVIPGYMSGSDVTYFTARAEDDTAFGGIEPVPASFRSPYDAGAVARDSVWGQSFVIDRMIGAGKRLLDDGETEVVLVPWGYDPACRTKHWQSARSLSARWVEPSERGVFAGELRPPSDWIGGRPTFDIPYAPHFPLTSPLYDGIVEVDDRLTPDQHFDLLVFLNSFPSRDSAARAFRGWADDHPELVQKFPANRLHARYLTSPPPGQAGGSDRD